MRLDVYRDDRYLGGYHIDASSGLRLGRDRRNDVILPHRTVSRHHANLLRQGSRYLLMDRSSNGTFVDGDPVDKVLLAPGAEISIGPFRLVLTDEDQTIGSAPTDRFAAPPEMGMVGSSGQMQRLREQIRKAADTSANILIIGETGAGKELVARAVHDLSPRQMMPFVAINCGAISPELVESELFGHVKGSFTGAAGDRKGAFEQAHGGTLFLDEIGELAPELQPKLLRVLESGEIRRVGAQGTVTVDVRLVAATHRDLRAEVEGGRFRSDLLYRLFVFPLLVPPLRSRDEDIRPLVEFFLGNGDIITREAMERLVKHPWPGNVRELKNVIERARIIAGGEPIGPEEIIFLDEAPTTGQSAPDTLPETFEELERLYYTRALDRSRGSIRAAARSLGIPKSTLYDRLRRYGISPGKDEDR